MKIEKKEIQQKNNTKQKKKKPTKIRGKETWNLATLNVRDISRKEIELNAIMEKEDLNILSIAETKKKRKGCEELGRGHLMIYSGVDNMEWNQEIAKKSQRS